MGKKQRQIRDNYYIKNAVLFEENSILLLPERLEASGVKSVWGEVSQESPKNLPAPTFGKPARSWMPKLLEI